MEMFNLYDERTFGDTEPRKKLIYDSEEVRWALFCLEGGQELPVHESTSRVSIYIIEGEGVFLGDGEKPFAAGSLGVFDPNEPHGFRAKTRCRVIASITPRP